MPETCYRFRWLRLFQIVLIFGALALGAGVAGMVSTFIDNGSAIALLPAAFMALVFVWLCRLAFQMPASRVTVGPVGTRVRFGGFIDTLIPPGGIVAARTAKHPWWGGLGVRTWFGSTVVLASAPGRVAELELREKVRVWLVPRVFGLKAQRLRVSVERPDELARQFPAQVAPPRRTKR